MRVIKSIAILACTIVLVGCSASSGEQSLPTPSATPPLASPRAPILPAVTWAEGVTEGQLSSMVLTISDDGLVTVQAEGPTPSTGSVLYSANLGTHQLGLKSVDGVVNVFVFDFTTGKQVNLTTAFEYSDGRTVMRAPSEEFNGIVTPFEWTGALSIDGADVGSAHGAEMIGG